MTKVTEKEKAIVSFVNERGFVSTNDLVSHFKLTSQTIRRYTKSLSDKGLIKRSHGGVVKLDFSGVAPVPVNLNNYAKPLMIESLSLICFQSLNEDNVFLSKVRTTLNECSRVDPIIYSITETHNDGGAIREARIILKKISRTQIAIFSKTLSDPVVNIALLAKKKSFETFLVCQEAEFLVTSELDLLNAQHIGLMSLSRFQSEWAYARI